MTGFLQVVKMGAVVSLFQCAEEGLKLIRLGLNLAMFFPTVIGMFFFLILFVG